MRRIIVLVIVLGLTTGLLGTFAFSQLFGRATAGPQAAPVREHNLDADGFIRVHAQGTANVDVTNVPLPVSGTVDVGNLPLSGEGRLKVDTPAPASARVQEITLQVDGNGTFVTPYFDMAACLRYLLVHRPPLLALVDGRATSDYFVNWAFSMESVHRDFVTGSGSTGQITFDGSGAFYTPTSPTPAETPPPPKLRIELTTTTPYQVAVQTLTGTLYCTFERP